MEKLQNQLAKNDKAQAQAKTAVAQVGTYEYGRQLMARMKDAITKALPKHLNSERMARIVLTEFTKNPDLLKCTQQSLAASILQSSQLGLEVGSGLGHAYLLPFKNFRSGTMEAQLVIGYQGMLEMAQRSGKLKSVYAGIVYEGDHFICKRSLEADVLEHEERYETTTPTHVYALARFTTGGYAYECWPVAKVRAHHERHKKGTRKSPWDTDWEAMAKKTLIRALFKFMPKSAEMADAMQVDGKVLHVDAETGQPFVLEDGALVDENGELLAENTQGENEGAEQEVKE